MNCDKNNQRAAQPAIRSVASTLAMLLLLGCAALPEAPVRPAVYDFGPGPLAASTPARLPALAPLTLADVEAPASLDSTAVLYRLGYADAQQLRPYALARWSMAPAQLVRQRLRETLGQRRSVLNAGESSVIPAGWLLRVELEEFTQLFDSAARSAGLVRLRATLWETGSAGERLKAQRSFVVQRPAASADAAGGVRALTAATDAAVEELAQWLQATP